MERLLRAKLSALYEDCVVWHYEEASVYCYVRFTAGDRLHMLAYHKPSSTAEIFELKKGGVEID